MCVHGVRTAHKDKGGMVAGAQTGGGAEGLDGEGTSRGEQ